MTPCARLLLGLLLLAAIAPFASAAGEPAEPARDGFAQASTQECKTSEPASNGLEPGKFPAPPPATDAPRAADVVPMSWSNVKALWG